MIMPTIPEIQSDLHISDVILEKIEAEIHIILNDHALNCLQGKEADDFYKNVAFPILKVRLPGVFDSSLGPKHTRATKHVRFLFSRAKRNTKRQVKEEQGQYPVKAMKGLAINLKDTQENVCAEPQICSDSDQQQHQHLVSYTEASPTEFARHNHIDNLILFTIKSFFVHSGVIGRQSSKFLY
jgi:hypothetical protein